MWGLESLCIGSSALYRVKRSLLEGIWSAKCLIIEDVCTRITSLSATRLAQRCDAISLGKVKCFALRIQTVCIYHDKMDSQRKTNHEWKQPLMSYLSITAIKSAGRFTHFGSLGLLYCFLGYCRKWLPIFSLKCSEWMISVFQSFPFCLDLSFM